MAPTRLVLFGLIGFAGITVILASFSFNLPLLLVDAASPATSANSQSRVSTSEGLTLPEVIAAFKNHETREEKGLQNVLVAEKSGGSPETEQFTPNLRVDVPVKVSFEQKQVSFQYFVDVRNDLTGSTTLHCTDIRIHVYLDRKEVFVTDWLGYEDRSPALPLQTDKITIEKVSPGIHEIGLIPEGRIGGCNTAFLLAWGGTIAVFQ